jgi:hypothetical protein
MKSAVPQPPIGRIFVLETARAETRLVGRAVIIGMPSLKLLQGGGSVAAGFSDPNPFLQAHED